MMRFPGFVPWLIPLTAALCCPSCLRYRAPAGPAEPAESGAAAAVEEFPAIGGEPHLILQTGEEPLWFELAEDGPRHIFSPGEAALSPFEPWPYARYISAMLARGQTLVMAVNRDGFLIAGPGEGAAGDRTGIRRVADSAYWGNYTTGGLFLLGGSPAVLLYRNSFFSDPAGEPPDPAVWGLSPGESRPLGLEVSAFQALSGGGWELDGLRRGPDGFWYYRGILRDPARPGIRYFRSADLGQEGEEVSLGAYRNSALPEPLRNAPPVLAETLGAIFFLAGPENFSIAAVISPDFEGIRYFAPNGAGNDENLIELSGYYRTGVPGSSGGIFDYAFLILPDGRGVWGRSAAEDPGDFASGLFSLPPLPEGFVYTGLGQAGKALIAPWEERQEGSLGAAGFMAVHLGDGGR
jgi:hypothetical protein